MQEELGNWRESLHCLHLTVKASIYIEIKIEIYIYIYINETLNSKEHLYFSFISHDLNIISDICRQCIDSARGKPGHLMS